MTMAGDITLSSHTTFFGQSLTAYIENGTVPESRIDNMATRIVAAWYYLHQDAPGLPKTNFNAFLPRDLATNFRVDVQDKHYKLVREMGTASTVLLKNIKGALPLTGRERNLFMARSDAGPADIGLNKTANFMYLISPYKAIQHHARRHCTSISWIFDSFDLDRARNMGIGQSINDLVLAVVVQNNNMIVVIHSVGPLILEPWIEHPNVTAVLWAGLPGTEAGNSLIDVLYSEWNPSGHLPYTIAKNASDYPIMIIEGDIAGETPGQAGSGEVVWTKIIQKNITPRFEFGFGLSYMTFKYSNLNIGKFPQTNSE
ncbi:glycoside hydrolase family 3 C-terminal domain-containing protein [Lentinula edodes]|uniref:beta-glucosidase n=1 Tax=Lentinula lateritia TaxID=40482 RepID=A0A9W9AYB5_9AGAR|nr:glycoside hydrolase family 3 C-terminal domain-containing protein [Lentinula edodes]